MSKNSQLTTTKTIRFPADIAAQTQAVCTQQGQTFTEFVLQAVYSALEDLRENENSLS